MRLKILVGTQWSGFKVISQDAHEHVIQKCCGDAIRRPFF